jgi:hypothetical protein
LDVLDHDRLAVSSPTPIVGLEQIVLTFDQFVGVSVCSTSDHIRSAATLDRNQRHQPKRCHRRNPCAPGETNLVCKCLVSSSGRPLPER